MPKVNHQVPTSPAIATRSLTPLPDGRVPGADRSVWLYGSIPLGSLRDAKSDDEKERLGARIQVAFEELALLTSQRALNRRVAKSSYREFQMLALNVPVWYRTPKDLPTKEMLDRYFRNELVLKRVVLIGVKLRASSAFKGGMQSILDEVAMVISGDGVPMSDFDEDAEKIRRAFQRAEIDVPDPADLRFADSWWNWSMERNTSRATPYVTHVDHLHFLKTSGARRALEGVGEELDCTMWPEELVKNPDQVAVTFGAAEGFDLEYSSSLDPRSHWGVRLLDNNARAISVRGLVEPAKITRGELRRQKKRFAEDRDEFAKANKQTSYEANEHESELKQLEDLYSSGNASCTLVDTSVLVALDGVVNDMSALTPAGMSIDQMTNRQEAAFHEMMLCSSVRANPHVLDVPATTIAYSGISSLSTAGDKVGALAGFTETDRQPVWWSGSPQASGDSLPIAEVAATTGSGKLLTLDTRLVTPTGTIAMQDVRVGTVLVGRDGLPCTVQSLSEINENPELYRLSISDGQDIDACVDHQWVVQLPPQLHERYAHLERVSRALRDLAAGYPRAVPIRLEQIRELLAMAVGEDRIPWASDDALAATLSLLDIDPARTPGRDMLEALHRRLEHVRAEMELLDTGEVVLTTGEMLSHGGRFGIRAAAADEASVQELALLLGDHEHADAGESVSIELDTPEAANHLLRVARAAGLVARLDGVTVSWAAGDQSFMIDSIVPIPSRAGRCITVDSPDHTYLCADRVPTHNTMLLLWLAHQWHQIGHPQFILDPKQNSDHSALVRNFGGNVRAFDELEGADGPLDPVRFSATPQAGVQLAADMLYQVSPWGIGEARKYENEISHALRYGVIDRGAKSTGEALAIAVRDGELQDSILEGVNRFVESTPMFQVAFGRGREESTIQLGQGMTLFMVGSAQFEMPSAHSKVPVTEESQIKRASANAIRMLIRAATAQLSNRSGIIHIDEAWMVELLAPGETQQLGRLARQMDVFPILYNQTPSTAIESGVENYISSGFLGYLNSPDEARAGMKLFGMEDNEDIYNRVLTPRGDPGRQGGMNWNSLQHLYAKGGERDVVRGSVFYHSDVFGRIAATEIMLPPEFLELASTNPEDIKQRRIKEQQMRLNGTR